MLNMVMTSKIVIETIVGCYKIKVYVIVISNGMIISQMWNYNVVKGTRKYLTELLLVSLGQTACNKIYFSI